jgi:hypothetical protein
MHARQAYNTELLTGYLSGPRPGHLKSSCHVPRLTHRDGTAARAAASFAIPSPKRRTARRAGAKRNDLIIVKNPSAYGTAIDPKWSADNRPGSGS